MPSPLGSWVPRALQQLTSLPPSRPQTLLVLLVLVLYVGTGLSGERPGRGQVEPSPHWVRVLCQKAPAACLLPSPFAPLG